MNERIRAILSQPTCSVDEAAEVLGVGRNAAYEAVRAGEIQSIRVRRRRRVITAPLRKLLGLEEAA